MKKAMSWILTLMLCLSLAACGGGDGGAKNTLYLNETKTIGDYAFTVTGMEFSPVNKLDSGSYSAGDGKVFLILHFDICSTAKEEVSPSVKCEVVYGDGYTFEGGLTMASMAPLSEAKYGSVAIAVPEAVEDDMTSALKVVVKGRPLGTGGDYTYYLNPMDEAQTEQVYQAAKALAENGFYDEAAAYFRRCGDYQDSAARLSDIAQYQDIIARPGAQKDALGSYRAVAGSELPGLLVGGDFMMSKTGEYWTFNEDYTLYDTYCNDNIFMNQYATWGYGAFQPTWSVRGDQLVVVGLNSSNGKETKTAYSVYEVGSGIFLLHTTSTEKLVGDLIGGDGTGVYSLYRKGAEEDRFLLP